MSNTYSQVNQIHSLSSIANAAFGLKFPQPNAYATLQTYVTTVITDTITQDQGPYQNMGNGNSIGNNYLGSTADNTAWQLVWGPIVFSNNQVSPTVVADNTMALFYNASQNLFVVAIAGTNGVSTYGWISEDFDVSTVIPWNKISEATGAPADAVISAGASNGLTALFGMTDPNNSNRTMLAQLQYFLVNNVTTTTPQAIAVAGHSLGGCLTPVMALYLFENQAAWNTGNKVNSVMAYPTAGPTPGDANFAAYYESVVTANTTPDPTSFTYTHMYNSIDVIPTAWELDTISKAPFLYDSGESNPTTPPDVMVASLTVGAIMASYNTSALAFNNYTHITPRTSMTGTYEKVYNIVSGSEFKIFEALVGIPFVFSLNATLSASQLYTPTDYVTYLTGFGYFVLEMAYQHTTAYNGLLGISDFATEYMYIRSTVNGPTGSTESPHALMAANMLAKFTGIKNISALAALKPANAPVAEMA